MYGVYIMELPFYPKFTFYRFIFNGNQHWHGRGVVKSKFKKTISKVWLLLNYC